MPAASAPPALTASICTATAVTSGVASEAALERGEVILLRCLLESDESLLHVGVTANRFDQSIVQSAVLLLRRDTVSTGVTHRCRSFHLALPVIDRKRNLVFLEQALERSNMAFLRLDDIHEREYVAEPLDHFSIRRARFVLVLQSDVQSL